MLSTAVQHAVSGTALGVPWLVSKGAAGCEPALNHVLALAEPAGPSRLPLSAGIAHHDGTHLHHPTPHSRSFFRKKKEEIQTTVSTVVLPRRRQGTPTKVSGNNKVPPAWRRPVFGIMGG